MNQIAALFDTVDNCRDELIALHQDLVRIPSINTGVMPTGNEIEACRYLEQRFSAEGIEYDILESAPTRGNFLAYLGSAPSPSLLLMAHLDVVPAGDESKWTYPPFAAEIADGKIYGRGSDDAKALVSSNAMACFILKRANLPINGRLIFMASADEESGGGYGAKWLAENAADKVRADYAVNEGGGNPVWTEEGPAYFLAVGEKGRSEVTITIQGKAVHAAQPWLGYNAIAAIGEVLDRIRQYTPELSTSLDYFSHVARLFRLGEEISPDNVDKIADSLSQSHRDLSSTLRALSRMTLTPTMISGGTKSNSLPDKCEIVCDVRTLPDQDEVYVENIFKRIIDGIEGADLKIVHTAHSGKSPAESEFITNIKKATSLAAGRDDILWLPGITRGFTDSRFIRPLGTDVYGFSPLTFDSDPVRRIHGIDESIEIDNLILRTKMNIALAYQTLNMGS